MVCHIQVKQFSIVYLGDDKTCDITRKRQIKIAKDDGCMRTLTDVKYIPKLRNNLISLSTLQESGLSYRSEGDRDILKVDKGALTLIRAKKTTSNIYKLLHCTIAGNVALVELDDDATKLWQRSLDHLSECGMMKIHETFAERCSQL